MSDALPGTAGSSGGQIIAIPGGLSLRQQARSIKGQWETAERLRRLYCTAMLPLGPAARGISINVYAGHKKSPENLGEKLSGPGSKADLGRDRSPAG